MRCILCRINLQKILAEKLRSGESQKVFYCSGCELGILEGVSSEIDVKKYYADTYRTIASPRLGSAVSPAENFKMTEPFQGDRIRLLKKYLTPKTKLLEIGCSAGMFLWHARKYVGDAVGLDYDKKSALFASKKTGCKVYTEDIETSGFKENSFDIICAFQTLEHVLDPIEFMKKIYKYLKHGGVVAIEVPNLRDALFSVFDVPAYRKFYFHASHTFYFSDKSISRLMRNTGFYGKNYFIQDYNILNNIHWIMKDGPQGSSSPGLSQPVFQVQKNTSSSIQKELNNFIQKADADYKKMLAKLGITSNIFFLGKKI